MPHRLIAGHSRRLDAPKRVTGIEIECYGNRILHHDIVRRRATHGINSCAVPIRPHASSCTTTLARMLASETELETLGIAYERIASDHALRTVADVMAHCDCHAAQVVKTLVLATDDIWAIAAVRGDREADLDEIRALTGASEVRLATRKEVARWTALNFGAVGPFGHPAGTPLFLDAAIGELDSMVCGSGRADIHLRVPVAPVFAAWPERVATISTA